jgi:hypothetical protein
MDKAPETNDPKMASNRAALLARSDLAIYSSLMWGRFQLPQHIKTIVDALEAVERGDIQRLMVFCPPRHGKSTLTSVLFPSWYLGRNPERSVIAHPTEPSWRSTSAGRCAISSPVRCIGGSFRPA